MSFDDMSKEVAKDIYLTKYLAGWSYVLSRDLVIHALSQLNEWEDDEILAPPWYKALWWEDVLVGILVRDRVKVPYTSKGFEAAWSPCGENTAVSPC